MGFGLRIPNVPSEGLVHAGSRLVSPLPALPFLWASLNSAICLDTTSVKSWLKLALQPLQNVQCTGFGDSGLSLVPLTLTPLPERERGIDLAPLVTESTKRGCYVSLRVGEGL